MPELPEVETIRRQLQPRLVGRTIVEAGSHWSDKFTPAVEATGLRITDAGRRGKFLLFGLGQPGGSGPDGSTTARQLVVHLGMTGRLQVVEAGQRPAEPESEVPYRRAWFGLDDGATLDFIDVRRFGRIRVVDRGDFDSIPALRNAGPEPWDPELDGRRFWQLLSKSKRPIKTRLLSQRPIAGVGNIYADEALWWASINPRARQVSRARATVLLDAIRQVLQQGVDNGGTTLRDYRDPTGAKGANQHELAAYGRAGSPCLRCDTLLASGVLDARTTTWCPRCQRR